MTKNRTARNIAATAKMYSFYSLFFFILKFILFMNTAFFKIDSLNTNLTIKSTELL
ncbi:hypothetical protein PI23P_02447 [Polaribacter irgensii 23-P]|uniref:Uncharacterized protein n=1 Tax=Polaribacter irgensii 23-P TaxID=313594 RepID=A4BWH6_9FLAO|nr:hypothetical protein PI23P_02447 [Polaribacter irgensii 23-P]